MKFLVIAVPTQVPMLHVSSLQRTRDWHQDHASLGCLMRVESTGCIAGILEAGDMNGLRAELSSYPDRDCYDWDLQEVKPMGDACAEELNARRTPMAMRDTRPAGNDSVFPGWMAR